MPFHTNLIYISLLLHLFTFTTLSPNCNSQSHLLHFSHSAHPHSKSCIRHPPLLPFLPSISLPGHMPHRPSSSSSPPLSLYSFPSLCQHSNSLSLICPGGFRLLTV